MPHRIVLTRGLARDQRHWQQLPTLLAQQFPHSTIEYLDVPGNGDGGDSYSSVPEAAAKIQTQLAADEHTLVIALSLGAMLMLQTQQQGVLIAINTSSRLNPFWQRFACLAFLKSWWCHRDLEAAIVACSSSRAPPATLSNWQRLATQQRRSWLNIGKQLLSASRFRPPMQINPHTVFVAGIEDRLVDKRCSISLALHYQKPLHLLRSGHDIDLDAAAEFVPLVLQIWQDYLRTK